MSDASARGANRLIGLISFILLYNTDHYSYANNKTNSANKYVQTAIATSIALCSIKILI